MLRRWKSTEAYLVNQIDEGLGIIPREVYDHLNLIRI